MITYHVLHDLVLDRDMRLGLASPAAKDQQGALVREHELVLPVVD